MRKSVLLPLTVLPVFLAVSMMGVTCDAQNRATRKKEKQQKEAQLKAAAQFCGVVADFVSTGRDGYELLKSSRNYDEGGNLWIAYDSRFVIPGAQKCLVLMDRQTGEQSYASCSFYYPGTGAANQEALLRWEKSVIDAIDPCLPRSWTKIDDRRPHPPGFFLKGEGDPGSKIAIELIPDDSGGKREVRVNFYPK
ncbi:MAG TPA: hypothetical protein VJX67_18450 [Blastocatellia bacterium]|nr:hypothetical protein [Blastocatellia bacterium]